MRKIVMGLVSIMALVSLAACSNDSVKKDTTKDTKASTEQSTTTESSSEKATDTSENKDSKSSLGNDTNFSLMIEASQSQIPALMEQMGEMYKNISIEEGKDSTVVYNYTFSEAPSQTVDIDALKPTMVKGMKPAIDQMKPLFPDVKVKVNYINPDGSELASFDITQEDTEKIEEN